MITVLKISQNIKFTLITTEKAILAGLARWCCQNRTGEGTVHLLNVIVECSCACCR